MRVVEARDDGRAARVEHPDRGQVRHLLVESDDATVQHTQGVGGGPPVVEGQDARIAHQQIEQHGISSPHRHTVSWRSYVRPADTGSLRSSPLATRSDGVSGSRSRSSQ